MNERLTIRNWHFEIFRWLPIGRCDIDHGSGKALSGAKRPGVMRAIKGNIGAAAAEKWNSFGKIAVKQKDGARNLTRLRRMQGQAGSFVAGARIKRRC
jgi:hypothetical protein